MSTAPHAASVSTVAYDGYPLDTALAALAEAGAHAAEIAFIQGYGDFDESAFAAPEAARLRAMLAREGLSSAAVSAHMDLGAPDSADRLRRRVDFACGLGVGILITNAGRGADRTAVMRTLDAVLPLCLSQGLVLGLENPGHGTDALFGRGADGAALARAFGTPALGLNYDAGNILTYSGGIRQPDTDLADTLPFVVHAHLKDARAAGPDWVFTPLGDGDVALKPVAAMLLAAGVPVGLELPLRLRRPGRADPVRATRPEPLPAIRDAVTRSLAWWNAAGEP